MGSRKAISEKTTNISKPIPDQFSGAGCRFHSTSDQWGGAVPYYPPALVAA